MEKVGNVELDESGKVVKIEREWYGQGMIFKDYDAFHNRKNEPCYVPELSDTVYTGKDFLEIAKGGKEVADMLFAFVDWQHPETALDEWFAEDEVRTDKKTGQIVVASDQNACDDDRVHCNRTECCYCPISNF